MLNTKKGYIMFLLRRISVCEHALKFDGIFRDIRSIHSQYEAFIPVIDTELLYISRPRYLEDFPR